MSFSLFLRGLLGVLVVFAIANYLITQSLWATFIQTVICAVIIQVGYFVAVLFMVWRSDSAQKGGGKLSHNEHAAPDIKPDRKGAELPGVRRSPLP
jgi:exopolysaccharide production repressor protein